MGRKPSMLAPHIGLAEVATFLVLNED